MRLRKPLAALAVLVGAVGGFMTPGSASAVSSDDDFRADIFALLNSATGQCADRSVTSTTGREVVQEPCTRKPTQVWLAQPRPDVFFVQIINQGTGLCMDLAGKAGDDIAVVQADCSPKLLSQQWQFVFGPVAGPVAESVRVVNRQLGLCLDVKDGSLAEGAPLQASTCDDSVGHQVWRKIPAQLS
jgi:hypothetical protein